MNFGARTAWAGVAHLPEVVVLVAVDYMVGGQILLPATGRLVVALQSFVRRAFKHGGVQVGGVKLEHCHQIFPCPADSFFLEVVAETPVAQHLKHGVVVGVVAHFLKVVVLSADTQAFLRVGLAAAFWFRIAEDDVLKLVHSGVGKHKCGVVLYHHGGRGNNKVSF